ncbi:hypothetical protein EYC84_006235 [Monilinia fructicola]|uniref:Uncharacterized protein n=1 Tax=Monilinia fructicola TaxID=38448 RepID=A0A5M9K666_MONFR|nr:hypothetical protein EYC84_006235 [Monilinia fructicola]
MDHHQYEYLGITIIVQKSTAAGSGRNPHDTFLPFPSMPFSMHVGAVYGLRPTKDTLLMCAAQEGRDTWGISLTARPHEIP